MRRYVWYFAALLAVPLVARFVPGGRVAADRNAPQALSASVSAAFVHEATAGNSFSNSTIIDNPATNSKPNAILLVTQNWSPHEIYNNAHIGVWYTGTKWSIFNQDRSALPIGAAFNVQVLSSGRKTFVHTAARSSIHGNLTAINKPSTNRKASALLQVTPNWKPHEVYVDHAIGVWYDHPNWTIFNQDSAAMRLNADFNVTVRRAGASDFRHVAAPSNIFGHVTDIDNPATNGNPSAILIVTPNFGPNSVYETHPIGVYYTSGNKWAIFTQDFTNIPDGAAFNVSVVRSSAL